MHAPLHECIHQAAFRDRWLNTVVNKLAGFPMVISPAFYRDFHFEHHRHTHDPHRDPEISAGGERFAQWPRYVHEYLVLASGLVRLLARLAGLAVLSVGLRALVELAVPFCSHERQTVTVLPLSGEREDLL